ncbi:MAG: FKBP-type peptidyl-prolyl cis-trans isomerase [Bacteroidales bacterium]|nr:FKBP-type peptidyl-prolyl cis-trans isomerase [Bacteroidales bacterium]
MRTTLILPCLLLLAACNNTPVIDTQKQGKPSYEENILNANKVVASAEETQIDSYVTRRGWHMTRLGDGVRYEEIKTGQGKRLNLEDRVAVAYKLEALDGTVIYDGQTDTVTLGRHEPCMGLDNAMTQLRDGSEARIIVPSAMGFGVLGDGDRIPARTVLIYQVKTNIIK